MSACKALEDIITKNRGFLRQSPACRDHPSFPARISCFSREVLAGSGPEHSPSLSHSIFTWKRFTSPGKPASTALVGCNLGAWLRSHTRPSLQGSLACACLRGGPQRRAVRGRSSTDVEVRPSARRPMKGFRWQIGCVLPSRLQTGAPPGLLSGTHARHFCYLGRQCVWVKLPVPPCHRAFY